MNGETGKFVRLGVLVSGAAVLAAGCASPFTPPPADPRSPVAAATDRAAQASGRFPTFADIPALPADVRDAAAFKAAVLAEKAAGTALERDTAPQTFTLSGTAQFAAGARAKARVPAGDVPSAADRAQTEAFAKAARARATPPPSQAH